MQRNNNSFDNSWFQSNNNVSARPDYVLQAIHQSYDALLKKGYGGYLFVGEVQGYSFSLNSFGLTTTHLLENLLDADSSKKIKVLDVGCGEGGFIDFISTNESFKDRVTNATGITATISNSARERLNKIPNVNVINENIETYFEGNAEKEKYDLIVSHAAIIHFVDPAATLVHLYNHALADNGLLVIQMFSLPGLDLMKDLGTYLQNQGYNIYITEESDIVNVIIRKTLPTLILPISYGPLNQNGKVTYSLLDENNFYNEVDRTFVASNNITDLETTKRLAALFHDEEYQRLPPQLQYNKIIETISTLPIGDSLESKSFIGYKQGTPLAKIANDTTNSMDRLYKLFSLASFQSLSVEEKLHIVIVVAYENYRQIKELEKIQAHLTKLGLDPHKIYKPYFFSPVNLTFNTMRIEQAVNPSGYFADKSKTQPSIKVDKPGKRFSL